MSIRQKKGQIRKSSNKKKVTTADHQSEETWRKEFNIFFTLVATILCISMIAAFLTSVSSADYLSGLETFKQKLQLIRDYFDALGISYTTNVQTTEISPPRSSSPDPVTPTRATISSTFNTVNKNIMVPIINVSAPLWEDENVPKNMIDGNLTTRWAYNGNSSIILDLGTIKAVDAANITWYLGNERQYLLEVGVSNESTKIIPVFEGNSGKLATETYEFRDDSGEYLNKTAQFVNVNISGNDITNWSSIHEISLIDIAVTHPNISKNSPMDNAENKVGTPDISGTVLDSPSFKAYIPLWGLVGSSSYVLVTTSKYMKIGGLHRRYIPEQISRLILGPAIAVVVFYIVSTGSFFGLSFDFTKIPTGVSPTYVYAAISFFVGYTTKGAITTFGSIIKAVFKIDDEEEGTKVR